jgi:uncharacterized protein YjbJ (UPF0337 family)
MRSLFLSLAALPAVLLAACDGPRENAGEVADNASGAVDSEDTLESGPAERLGEAQDRAADAARDAIETRADALEDTARAGREEARRAAEELEQQADKLREGK